MAGIKVLDLSSFFERVRGQVRIDSLRASWLIYGEGFRQGLSRALVKRVFDLVASFVLLVLATPVMLLAALLIVLEDGAPVFYRQERVGQGGRLFKVIKFRSMRRDAERDGKPRWASANDDRVTRVGRFIRKVRIDELPQLFNVLRGDMSLVGPRPITLAELPRYGQVRWHYLSVRPGMTGLWQVSGRNDTTYDERVELDREFVEQHSLRLRLSILLRTLRVVIRGSGAR